MRAGGVDRLAGGQIVALVFAAVEIHLVRPGYAVDEGSMVVRGIDDECLGPGREVARSAAQQQVVIWAYGGAVRSAGRERNDALACRQIKQAQPRDGIIRIGYQQAAAARRLGSILAVVAARWIVFDDRDRGIETLGLGIPGRLLDRQAESRREDRRVHRNSGDDERIADGAVAIGGKQRPKRRVLSVVGAKQQLTVPGNIHLVEPSRAAGADRLLDGARRRRVKVDHLERAVAVAGIEPSAVRDHTVWPGVIVVNGGAGFFLEEGPLA